MITQYVARFVTRHRLPVLAIGILFFVVFTLGIFRARFSTDYRIFFSSDDSGLTAFEKLESTFTKTDNVLFVVKSADGIFTDDGLAAVKELTAEGWKIPFASRVDSLTNFQRARATDDDIVVGELGAQSIPEMRSFATHEPLLSGSLLSKDEKTAAVNVTLRLPRTDPREVSIAADAARALVKQVSAKHPNLEIRPCGMAFMNDAFMQASLRDMGIMIPLMVVVMLVAMAFVLRSAWATGAVASILFMSAATSMAIAGWLKYPLTPPAIAAPMMVLTVAVADGVHIVLATMDALSKGMNRRDAVQHAIQTNLEAVTYTWLTTIVGFVCLNYSEAPPVRHLANMTCVGVTVAFVFSVSVLPAMLVGLPLKARPEVEGTRSTRLAKFVMQRRGWVLGIAAVVTMVLGWQASRLETNDQFVQYFGHSLEFRRDVDFTMKNLSGIYRLEMQVGSEAGVSDPKYLERLDAFSTYLREQPEVQHVYGLSDIAKRVHEATSGTYALPDTREGAAQDMLLYEMGLPAGLGLDDRVSVDKTSSRLTITVRDMSTKEMREVTARIEGWLKTYTPPAMHAEATGPVVIFSQLSDRNAKSMVQGDFVSLVLISICMMLVLRSAKLGILSVVPNVIPIVIGYGVWRLAVGQMNIVASVAGSISLGVIVDDTIHFLTKYKQLAKKHEPEKAMAETLSHVGPAMLSTSVILVLGFAVLCFSSFQMTSWLGWLSVLVVGIAPIADLILVPALVVTFSGKKKKKGSVMKKLALVTSVLLFATVAHARTPAELTASGSPEEKGTAIAKELGARNTGWKDLGAEVSMTLKDAGGSEAQRKFRIKVLERPDASSGDWLMVTFDAPADVKGTAVLSHAKVEGEDEQWLYLPASKRTKRVSSSNKTGSFAGSEFSFEDLAAGDGRKYTWKLLGQGACGSLTCMNVEATPKDSSSAYSRRVLNIDTTEMRVQSIEFFDKKNTKQKTLAYSGYEKIDGKFWRAKGWTMTNHQSGKSTVLTFGTIKMGNGFTTSDFGATKLGD